MVPPKLSPLLNNAAASGTLPIEQTKLMNATSGPTITFSSSVRAPCPETKTTLYTEDGTATARTPATR